MAMSPGSTSPFGLLLVLALATQGAQGDTCYSQRSGFSNCRSGCCGPDNDEECCSNTILIIGLVLGIVLLGLVVVMAVLCWVCTDCRSKACRCCHGSSRRGSRGRRGRRARHGAQHRRARRVLVHPVEPPDYVTATQERAPSVQPGLNHRSLPLSPPPPYMETETVQSPASTVPLPSPTHRSSNITTATAPAGTFLVSGSVARLANAVVASNCVAGQPSNAVTSASGATVNMNSLRTQDGHSVFVIQGSGPGSIHSSSTLGNSSNEAGLTPAYAATHRKEATFSAKSTTLNVVPGINPSSNSGVQSPVLIHVTETSRVGGSNTSPENARGGSSQQTVFERSHPSGGAVLHTVSESAEDVDHFSLI